MSSKCKDRTYSQGRNAYTVPTHPYHERVHPLHPTSLSRGLSSCEIKETVLGLSYFLYSLSALSPSLLLSLSLSLSLSHLMISSQYSPNAMHIDWNIDWNLGIPKLEKSHGKEWGLEWDWRVGWMNDEGDLEYKEIYEGWWIRTGFPESRSSDINNIGRCPGTCDQKKLSLLIGGAVGRFMELNNYRGRSATELYRARSVTDVYTGRSAMNANQSAFRDSLQFYIQRLSDL